MANRLIEGTFRSPGNLELVTRDGGNPTKLVHLWRENNTGWATWSQAELISSSVNSAGALIQSSFGTPDHPGNFEVLVLEGKNLVHYYKDNSSTSNPWTRADPKAFIVSTSAVAEASFIQSTFKTTPTSPGNFEAVVLESISPQSTVFNLVHYYKDNSNTSNPWKRTAVITSQASASGCIIQSNLGTAGHPGNFEVVVLEGTNLVHYYRDNATSGFPWHRTTEISTVAASPGCIIQGNLGGPPGNFEVVVLEGQLIDEQKSLVHYYRDNVSEKWFRTVTISVQSQGAASLIQSRFGPSPGNLEVVVLEGAKGAHSLDQYSRNDQTDQWSPAGLVVSFPFDSFFDG